MDDEVMLSVIVPVYNAAMYLGKCLKSILAATNDIKAEIIIIDDGSKDMSPMIERFFSSKYPNVRVIRLTHQGPGTARNHAMQYVRGKYMAFADADDFVSPDMYTSLISAMERDGSDMATCNLLQHPGGGVLWWYEPAFKGLLEGSIHISEYTPLIHDCLIPNKVIRTSFYRDHGLAYSNAMAFEDMQLAIALQWEAKSVSYVDINGYYYRKRRRSLAHQDNKDGFFSDHIEMIRKSIEYVLQSIDNEKVKTAAFHKLFYYDVFSYFPGYVRTNDDEEIAKKLSAIKQLCDEYPDELARSGMDESRKEYYDTTMRGDVKQFRASMLKDC